MNGAVPSICKTINLAVTENKIMISLALLLGCIVFAARGTEHECKFDKRFRFAYLNFVHGYELTKLTVYCRLIRYQRLEISNAIKNSPKCNDSDV